MTREKIIDDIVYERCRQEMLKSSGKFSSTCADQILSTDKLSILTEEIGEVARAINEADTENLREELVQVAAVCVAWLESL